MGRAGINILRLIQLPFGFVFCLIEQRIAKIEDDIANNGRPQ
jgi:hypothetical protein